MSSPTAAVQTDDLEAVLDYLQGFQLILAALHAEQRGREGDDPLLTELQEMDCFSPEHWEPLRYQDGLGQGWQYVAETMTVLRDRLVESYGNAAL